MNHDLGKLPEIYARYPKTPRSLIAVLQDIQKEFHFLPCEALKQTAEHLDVPLSKVFSVSTFYNAFSLKPKGKHCMNVCMGTACHVRGSPKILDRLETKLDIKAGETTRDHLFTLETVNCVGACALGPVVITNGEYSGQLNLQKIDRLLKNILSLEERA